MMKNNYILISRKSFMLLLCILCISVVFGQKSELPSEARAIPNYRELWSNEPFSKYDPATEMVEKRDQVSKHFRNADGTITAHIASGPIHYWEDGQWKTIFHTIEEKNNDILINKYNSWITEYPKNVNGKMRTFIGDVVLNEMQNLSMYYEIDDAQLNRLTAVNSTALVNINEITYENVFDQNIDLVLTQNSFFRKMDYVINDINFLNSIPSGSDFLVFEETVNSDINLKIELKNNEILIFDTTGNLIAKYAQPEIRNNDHKCDSDNIRYELFQNDAGIIIRTKVAINYFDNLQQTSFPIFIDPTLIVYPANQTTTTMLSGSYETAFDPSAGKTFTCTSGTAYSVSTIKTRYSPGFYLGSDNLGYSGTAYDRQVYHGWTEFNTSGISDNATISSIEASFYLLNDLETGASSSVAVSFNKITNRPSTSLNNSSVGATDATLLADIWDGEYLAVAGNASNNFTGTVGWKTKILAGTSASDLQNQLPSDWFALGLETTCIGNTSTVNDWIEIANHTNATYRPYITVTYITVTVPTVTTTTASSIGNFTASSGGNVTSDGGASVTARGVQWSTSPLSAMPSGSTSSDGTGTGSFTSSLTGLSASTVYYYRAYALNSVGYGYGSELSFVTTGPSAEGYYISGNIENNGTIISTSDVNYIRMTGGTSDATKKTITGNGTFTDSKLFADGYIEYQGSHAGKFNETFVNSSKTLVIQTGKTYPNGTMSNYGTLTLNGTGIITNTGSVINGGTLTVASTGEITVGGSWTNNSTFTPGSGQVTFDGSSNSIIGGSSAISFYKLKMNKSASSVTTTLAANATVTNTLTLTMGNLVTSSYNAYVSNNSSAAVSGGSSDSYVKGNLKRAVAGINTYVFPVGQSLYEEARLQFTAGYTSADITAFFTDASPGSLPAGGLTQSGTNIVGILDKGYWSIDPSAGAVGSPTYTVTLKETGHANGTTNAANYTVIKRQNTPSVGDWSIQGTHSNTTQSDVAGVVTAVRSGLNSFSDFAIGYGSAPLPIELSSFQANCSDNNTVDVTWTTASEHNTNYFRVDKSRNGTQWDVLGTIGAAGNSTYMIDYALTDQFPNPGINYYRLTQYDLDGVFETFDAQAAVCKDQQAGTALSSYPNPSSGDFNVDLQTDELEGEGVLIVTDAKGAVIHSQDIKIIKGTNNYIIQHFQAEPGIYYISVKSGASTVTTKHSLR